MYELRNVEKRFPGVHALKSVNLEIRRGEVVGLVGENGAGKFTLMKVISGAYQPDGGQILIDGKSVAFANPRQAMEKGTRGLDIGAKEDVYDMVRDMSDDGVDILLVADTLEEAIGLSHTILVLRDGEVRQRFDCAPGAKPTPFDLLHYMV